MNNNSDISNQELTIISGNSCLMGSKQRQYIYNLIGKSFFWGVIVFISMLFSYPVYAAPYCSAQYDWDTSGWGDGDKIGTITLIQGLTATIDVSTDVDGVWGYFGGVIEAPLIDSVSGARSLYGGIPDLGIVFDPDADTGTSPITAVIIFSEPVYNGSFLITDIDMVIDGTSDRSDKITVTSDIGIPQLEVVSTNAATVTVGVTGNVAEAIDNGGAYQSNDDPEGSVRVIIPNGATSITVVYEDSNTEVNDHGQRGIGLYGEMSACTNGPVAVDDTLSNPAPATPTNPTEVDVVGNDTDPDNNLDLTTVKIIDADGNPVTELVVTGEGTWTVDPTTGVITFTPAAGFTADPTPIKYTVKDKTGLLSNEATVTVDYPQTAPVAVDDIKSNPDLATPDNPTAVDVVGNDTDPENDLDPTTVKIIDADGNPVTELVVIGEGKWVVDPTTGKITFTPAAGFTASPTPIKYTVKDKTGLKSNGVRLKNNVSCIIA